MPGAGAAGNGCGVSSCRRRRGLRRGRGLVRGSGGRRRRRRCRRRWAGACAVAASAAGGGALPGGPMTVAVIADGAMLRPSTGAGGAGGVADDVTAAGCGGTAPRPPTSVASAGCAPVLRACGVTESTIAWICAPAVWICKVTALPTGSGTVVLMPRSPAPVCSIVMPLDARSMTVPVRKAPSPAFRNAAGTSVSSAEAGAPWGRDAGDRPEPGLPTRVMARRRHEDGGIAACPCSASFSRLGRRS